MADPMASSSGFSVDGPGDQNVAFGHAVQYNDRSDHRNITVNVPGMSSMLYLAQAIKGGSSDSNGLERIAIIDWLKRQPDWPPSDSHHRQVELHSQMMPGTGEWVLSSSEFQAWKDPKSASRILPMHGHLGSGKSMLVSLITDTIKKEAERQRDTACIYFYPQKEDDASSPARIWATLLAQLLQHKRPGVISEKLFSSFNASFQGSSLLHPLEYWGLFNAQAETFDTVYLILDDPNSYLSNNGSTLQSSWDSLKKLPSKVRLLFTSRDRMLATHLGVNYELRITPNDTDIVKYVKGRLERDTHLSQLLKNPNDRELVVHQVTSLTFKSGIFLLARLHMDDLSRCCTLDSVKRALESLPTNVKSAFQGSINQITRKQIAEKDEQFDIDLARHVLTWIVHAKVSLSVNQILESFAIQDRKGKRYRDLWPTTERLISATAGLIIVDSDKNTVRLVHESAKGQLQKRSVIYEKADLRMAKTCLNCLLSEADETDVDGQASLLSYAANHWSSHLGIKCQDADEEAMGLIKAFLNDSAKLTRAFKAIPDTLGPGLRGMTGLHAAVYFDLRSYAKSLMGKGVDINAKCANGQTALHWAVKLSRHSLLRKLLRNSADTNVRDRTNNTPLHRALMVPGKDGISIVRALLDGGAKPDIPGTKGLTAILSAIRYGPTVIAEIMLRSIKDMNTEISSGWTPLRELFVYDYKAEILGTSTGGWGQLDHAADEHVKYLINVVLDLGMDLNRPTSSGWLPLIHAIQTQNVSRVRHLLERVPRPANVNQRDPNNWSPVRWAITYKVKPDVLRLLIKHGADVNEKDKDGWTPLISAVKNNDEDSVWLLLKGGANPDVLDNDNWTALLYAIDHDYKSIIWLLISNKADVRLHNNKAFDLSMERHNRSLAWLLLENGADPNVADDKGITPLHRAAGSGDVKDVEDVRFLLHWGADTSRQDKRDSNTPLHIAVWSRLDNIVAELASKSKPEHLEIKDARGNTALMLATILGLTPIVRILLKNKASYTTRDPGGLTAIAWAANLGLNDALKQMVRRASKHDVNLTDERGYSALHHAVCSSEANTDTIHILVERGADLYAEEKEGALTPLMLAVYIGKHLQLLFVRQLLDEGADVRAQNSQGRTVMELIKPDTDDGIRSSIEKAVSRGPQQSSGYGAPYVYPR